MARAPDLTAPDLTIVACGALAHELVALRDANGWHGAADAPRVRITCLPAALHNRPDAIPFRVERALRELGVMPGGSNAHVFVAYADCGTGGRLDAVLGRYGVGRLPGAHCYQFYAGKQAFEAFGDAELGTFYLTDFLARHFERLIWRDMGIEAHPELLPMYFGHYRKVLYLAQRKAPDLEQRARDAAQRLGLDYEYRYTGLGELRVTVQHAARHAARHASCSAPNMAVSGR